MNITQSIGMIKSRLIYDFKPFIQDKMRRFYSALINKDDLCFDIGAHTGNRSEAWLRMGAKVIALEPQPVFAKFITRKLGDRKNFTLLPQAVGDKPGVEILYISHGHPAISTLSKSWIQVMKDFDPAVKFEDTVEITVTTLDFLIKEYGIPQFCKIDVEGFEEKVIMGLSQPISALSFEFFPTALNNSVICINLLERLGSYRYNWSFIESFKLNSSNWLTDAEMIETILRYKGRRSGDIYALLNK